MRNPTGWWVVSDPEARGPQEWDTFTCGHYHQAIVRVPPRGDPAEIGGLCYGCGSLICARCVRRGRCDTIEAGLARAEARAEALRSYGLPASLQGELRRARPSVARSAKEG